MAVTELRCDLDGPFPEDFLYRVSVLCRHQAWTVTAIMIRKTKHGWHAIITLDAMVEPIIIVAAQAILGSDWKRENFNLFRAQQLPKLPATWREARRWNALYTSHVHFT